MTILCAASPGEVRVAVVEGDDLLDYALWRPGRPDGVGDLHRGRLTKRMPAMGGSFVRLVDADGFLPDSETASPLHEGMALGVRVTRAAQGGKGPRLSALLTPNEAALIGTGPPALLRRGPNAVLRMMARYPEAEVVVDSAAILAELRAVPPPPGPLPQGEGETNAPSPCRRGLGEGSAPRFRLVGRVFDPDLESRLAALADSAGDLPGGARFSIHPTPALTAIDIDLAGATAARGGKARSQTAANHALIPALAHEIRLRDLAGAILIDFAGLSARRRAALGPALTEALTADPLGPKFLGFTGLGLAEILRPRVHPPLYELLAGPHAAGLVGLRALAAEIAVNPRHPPVLSAAPAVAAALEQDSVALADLANRAGRPLILRPDPALAPLGWRLDTAT